MLARGPKPRSRALLRAALGATLALSACASKTAEPQSAGVSSIQAGEYEKAFQAAKDTLRAAHFDLARVDAAAGVITTHARSSSGLATPWIDHADSFDESVKGLLHRDRRRAVVLFHPADVPEASPFVDRRGVEGALLMEVRVDVERTYVTGRRDDPTSIRLTSQTIDPHLLERDLHPIARDTVREDEKLASRIARTIEEKLSGETP